LFESAIPGCAFDDRSGPNGSRVARSFCVATCTSNGDCRGGYTCVDPRTSPWNATILDDDQAEHVCLPIPAQPGDQPDAAIASVPQPPVCGAVGPTVPPIEAGAAEVQDAGITVPPLFPSSVDGGR
jgi:hypothetical protein